MDETTQEEEDEEGVFYSSEDRRQIRNVLFQVLKNFIRLLSKFSLKEKPECIQNCVEVSENARDLGQVQREWKKPGLFLVSVFQVFVALTSFEPVRYEFQVTQAR